MENQTSISNWLALGFNSIISPPQLLSHESLKMMPLTRWCCVSKCSSRKTSPIENRNQFPEPVPEPWGPTACPNPIEPGTIFGILEPHENLLKTHRNLEPFQEPPQRAQNTPKSILCKDHIAFCCWGKICIDFSQIFHFFL